jgi:mono/diheme cytochrome c family protein
MVALSRSALLVFGILFCTSVFAQSEGETLFTQTCVACHTIGGGKLVGPDLSNVHVRRDEAWIIQMVQSSQGLIEGGDAVAVGLFEEYNRLPMPDHPFSDDQVRSIIGYIARLSPPVDAPVTETTVEPVGPVVESDVEQGLDLFVGRTSFENGGAACNSCHHVNTDVVMTGGALAKDLTDAVSRLTRPGVEAMMANPPYPAMRQAFEDRPLTDEEVSLVSAFLQDADEHRLTQETRNYGNTLLSYGIIGAIILLGFFSLIGIRSTKRTVNHEIYERQIKST